MKGELVLFERRMRREKREIFSLSSATLIIIACIKSGNVIYYQHGT